MNDNDPSSPRPLSSDQSHRSELIGQLEEKTRQLEEMNRALQREIFQRKGIEEDLRKSEERFRATFEQAAVGIAHLAVDGRFLWVNDKLCEITGYSREELLHLSFVELSVPQDRAEGEEARRAMLAGRRSSYSSEKSYLRKNGSLFWASVAITLSRTAAGEPDYFISIIADISERKKLDGQFLRAQRMESIGTLAGGIAHDLNNVLAPIVMSLHLLKLKLPKPEEQQWLTVLETSCQRGADLVKQVLSFARGIDGERVTVNPLYLMRDLLQIMRDTFPKSIEVAFTAAPDLWTVTGDATQLHQVILNLCVNARDAMPGGGSLSIHMENVVLDETYAVMNPDSHAGNYVILNVADTGTGIAPEVRDKIFEPFFTTKEIGLGTGLGLSTTAAIVKSHGGFINVYSEPGKGTKFKVYLPANTTETATDKTLSEQTRLPRGKGECVLVVDDEEAIRTICQRTLERFGYRVLLAANGAEAVSLYAQHQAEIAVVLTDMAMPIMDGPALIIALKAMNPHVRIIGSSGLTAHVSIAQAVGEGVSHFVPKPYNAEALLGTLQQVLSLADGTRSEKK